MTTIGMASLEAVFSPEHHLDLVDEYWARHDIACTTVDRALEAGRLANIADMAHVAASWRDRAEALQAELLA